MHFELNEYALNFKRNTNNSHSTRPHIIRIIRDDLAKESTGAKD